MRDTGDLVAAGRGRRFSQYSDKINENPTLIMDALIRLRLVVRWHAYFCNYNSEYSLRQFLTLRSRKQTILGCVIIVVEISQKRVWRCCRYLRHFYP